MNVPPAISEFVLGDWQIRMVLPHRPPVLQLDRVTASAAALDRLDAVKALGGSDAMLRRSADDGGQLAPGALIEALAQCCGLLLRLRWLSHAGADLQAFAAGDSAQVLAHDIPRSVLAESEVRFGPPVVPGQVLHLVARLVLSRGDMHRFETSARVEPSAWPFPATGASGAADAASARIMLGFPRLPPPPQGILPKEPSC